MNRARRHFPQLRWLVAFALLICALASSWAQAPTAVGSDTAQNAIEDCNSDDVAKRLVGCTLLINEAKLAAGDLAVAHSRRSDSYLEKGELDKAIADRAKAFELQPHDLNYKRRFSEGHRLRAAVARAKGRYDEALVEYSTAIRIDPSNADAYGGRGELFFQRKDIAKAEVDFKAAAELEGGEPYSARLSRIHEARGIEHVLKKNYDAALKDYTEAIRLDPANAKLHLDRGAVHAAKTDLDRAIRDYSEAIRLKPDLVEAYVLRGELFRAHGALPRALADFDEAIKRDPKNVTALMMRAFTREERQQRDGAISDYRAILQIEPTSSAAKSGLARLDSGALKSDAHPEVRGKADNEKTAKLPPPARKGTNDARHWLVGTWRGEVKGLNDGRIGDLRTLIVTGVREDGTVVGRWADGSGKGGQGTSFGLSGEQLTVTTTYANRVTLRRSGAARLNGTFLQAKTGKRFNVTMSRE